MRVGKTSEVELAAIIREGGRTISLIEILVSTSLLMAFQSSSKFSPFKAQPTNVVSKPQTPLIANPDRDYVAPSRAKRWR